MGSSDLSGSGNSMSNKGTASELSPSSSSTVESIIHGVEKSFLESNGGGVKEGSSDDSSDTDDDGDDGDGSTSSSSISSSSDSDEAPKPKKRNVAISSDSDEE